MFNEDRIEALEKRVQELEAACTMRVGDFEEFATEEWVSCFFAAVKCQKDGRPTVTAIELLELLMARQRIKPIVQRGKAAIEATPDKVVLSKPRA